jgi:PucR family transcriptional regulator, purine catabolism regulatory protein
MPATLRNLLDIRNLGLSVVAGEGNLDRQIRWAHVSELQDPTPWLKGGELLLTTGMGLEGSPALQRSYIRRLVKADIAGLGFGIGFGFDAVPEPIRRAAEREGFPVLVVPYPVPFIAVVEAVSSALSEDRLREAQSSVEIHDQLASLVADGSGPADVLDEIVELTGGWAVLFDMRGQVLASSAPSGTKVPEAGRSWANLPDGLTGGGGPRTSSQLGPEGRTVSHSVMSGKRQEGVLVLGKPERLSQRDQIAVRHGVTVLGLLLSSRRAVIEAERRVAGDVVVEALTGTLDSAELVRRLILAGFPEDGRVAAIVIAAPSVDADVLEEISWVVDASLGRRVGSVRVATIKGKVVAVVSAEDVGSVVEVLLEDLRAAPSLSWPYPPQIGFGEPVDLAEARRSYLTALFALRASSEANPIAGPEDLGSYTLLLGGQPKPVLEGLVAAVLGPLLERDADRSSELVSSIRAFIEAGGRWEPGAEALGVHRHTLRYRVRLAEELMGRDLSNAEDRMEVWLALKAVEVLSE